MVINKKKMHINRSSIGELIGVVSKIRLSRQFQACLFCYEKISRAQKAQKHKTSDFHPLRSLCAREIVSLVV